MLLTTPDSARSHLIFRYLKFLKYSERRRGIAYSSSWIFWQSLEVFYIKSYLYNYKYSGARGVSNTFRATLWGCLIYDATINHQENLGKRKLQFQGQSCGVVYQGGGLVVLLLCWSDPWLSHDPDQVFHPGAALVILYLQSTLSSKENLPDSQEKELVFDQVFQPNVGWSCSSLVILYYLQSTLFSKENIPEYRLLKRSLYSTIMLSKAALFQPLPCF